MSRPAQIVRLIEILRRLPRLPRRIDAGEMAVKLQAAGFDDITQRVIADDLRILAKHFYSVDCDTEGKPHRWGWAGAEAAVAMTEMEPVDAALLALAEPMLREMAAGAVGARLESVLAQARDTVRWSGKLDFLSRVRGLPEALPRRRPLVREGVLEGIVAGLADGRRLDALYKARNRSRATDYSLEPLALVAVGPTSLLVARKQPSGTVQHFELQRFHRVAVTEEGASLGGFDLEAHIASGELAWPVSAERVELELELGPKYRDEVLDAPLGEGQVVESMEPCRVRVTVADTHALQRFVLGLGREAMVRGPASYVARMAAEAGAMATAYGVGGGVVSADSVDVVRGVLVPASVRTAEAAELLASITWQLVGWARAHGARVLGPGYRVEGLEASPDISVYRHGLHGAPDLAVDLLDGPARARSRVRKGIWYAERGVRERWLVDLEAGTAERLALHEGAWLQRQAFELPGALGSDVLEGLVVTLGDH